MPDDTEDGFANHGDDEVRGGPGRDRVSYELANDSTGVRVDLDAGVSHGRGTDSLTSIELLTGSHNDDVLLGDSMDNVLAGLSGDDELRGRAGDDVVRGGHGQDTCSGEQLAGCE